jgi:hypothetical protein
MNANNQDRNYLNGWFIVSQPADYPVPAPYSTENVHVLAAIFADGARMGDPAQLAAIQAVRVAHAQALQSITQSLCGMGQKGFDFRTIDGYYNSHRADFVLYRSRHINEISDEDGTGAYDLLLSSLDADGRKNGATINYANNILFLAHTAETHRRLLLGLPPTDPDGKTSLPFACTPASHTNIPPTGLIVTLGMDPNIQAAIEDLTNFAKYDKVYPSIDSDITARKAHRPSDGRLGRWLAEAAVYRVNQHLDYPGPLNKTVMVLTAKAGLPQSQVDDLLRSFEPGSPTAADGMKSLATLTSAMQLTVDDAIDDALARHATH